MLVSQGTAAHQVAHDDAALALGVVFEADDDHPVAGQTAAPAVVAIFLADLRRGHELEVAVCAHVVIAAVAFQTMKPRNRGRDWVGADVAFGGEGEGLEAVTIRWCGRTARCFGLAGVAGVPDR